MTEQTRYAALADARLIYKCESKKHITTDMDRTYYTKVNSGVKLSNKDHAKHNHEGCEVHVVMVHLGSSPVVLEPCKACGHEMVLVEGVLPIYKSFPCDEHGLIENELLVKAAKTRR
jgi:hypothetical protein